MAIETHVNDAGTWRKLSEIHVNDAGTWRKLKELWVNDAGTWRQVFSAAAIVNPLGTHAASNFYASGGADNAYAAWGFDTDGTVDKSTARTTFSWNNANDHNWYSPTTGSIGSSYWFKVTKNGAGDNINYSNVSYGTIYQLNSLRYFGFLDNAALALANSNNVYLYSDGAGTTQVSSGQYDLDAFNDA